MNWQLVLRILLLMSVTAGGFPVVLEGQAPAKAALHNSHPVHLHSNLWMQTAAEYQAVCKQTFNAALKEIKQVVKSAKRRQGRPVGHGKKLLAVVADLDETILDNARFQSEMDAAAMAYGDDKGYTDSRWNKWVEQNAEEVELVPGARSFIAEVEKLMVVMVYISNRPDRLKGATIQALAHNQVNTQRLQDVLELRLLLKGETSNKQARIKQVEEKYAVVAYLGDNLSDFPGETGQPEDVAQRLAARRQKMEAAAQLWGTRWFMLPNPVYGDWDRVLPGEAAERIQFLKRANNPAFVEAK